jgi:adenosine deaminase
MMLCIRFVRNRQYFPLSRWGTGFGERIARDLNNNFNFSRDRFAGVAHFYPSEGTMFRRAFSLLSFVVIFAAVASAQPAPQAASSTILLTNATPAKADAAFQAAVKQGDLALREYLVEFPKGADLHVHLSGAVYAETFIRDAGEDGLCVDPKALGFSQPPCSGNQVPASDLSGNVDSAHQALYDKLVDAFSMRSFVASAGWSGHDQFFATFGRFGGLKGTHSGEWVDEAANLAAEQNNQYLELMETPAFSHAAQLGRQAGWSPSLAAADPQALAQFRQQLLSQGLAQEVQADRDEVSQAEASRKKLEQCGTPQAAPACQVETRYIYQILRANPPEQVFAQTLLGFETVHASLTAKDDTWVGINFVQPEDDYIAMRDYTLQMKIVGYLHTVYPDVPISLHAGELAYGMVPPEGLRFHIRQAVEIGEAQRIGHGVDLMYEDKPQELLKELAQKHVMIEINLTSNEGILGISGKMHPFSAYLAAKVPIALSTDDEGVSRIDLTHEYVRAALDYNLTYSNLVKMARTGMEHSFLPGASLWPYADHYAAPVKECEQDTLGGPSPSAACKAFLDSSEKASAQWEFERRLAEFQAKYAAQAKKPDAKTAVDSQN